jgi:hypothetical protein
VHRPPSPLRWSGVGGDGAVRSALAAQSSRPARPSAVARAKAGLRAAALPPEPTEPETEPEMETEMETEMEQEMVTEPEVGFAEDGGADPLRCAVWLLFGRNWVGNMNHHDVKGKRSYLL